MKIIKYAFTYLKKHPFQMALFVLVNIVIWFAAIFLPYITGNFIDSLVKRDAMQYIYKYAFFILVVNAVNVVFQYMSDYINNKLQNTLGFDAKYRLFKMIKKYPMKYFKDKDVVYLNELINEDVAQIFSFVFTSIVPILTNIFTVIISVVILLKINAVLMIILVALIPVYILLYKAFKTPLFKANYDMREERNVYQAYQTSQFINVKHIKANALFDEVDGELYNRFIIQFKKVMRFFHLGYFFSNVGSVIMVIANVIIVFYGGYKVIDGTITVGQFTIVNTYFNMIIQTTNFFLSFGNEYQQTLVSYKRLTDIEGIHIENNGNIQLSEITSIELENLSFAYEDKVIINGVTYSFEKGNAYIVRGSNGAGKTTLINLMIGLYQEFDTGTVRYNGEAISNLDLYHLRHRLISIQEQDAVLFGSTVRECLTFGTDNIDQGAVSYWCNKLGVSELIEKLPDKYETNLNEHNISFSGGEQQKLSLVRCFIKNPSVMILDEPTSAFDSGSVEAFADLINEYKKSRIVIIITHDEALIEKIDGESINLDTI